MRIYLVWDNADYGSTFSPDQDYIDSAYYHRKDADGRADHLNNGRKKWRSMARVTELEVK